MGLLRIAGFANERVTDGTTPGHNILPLGRDGLIATPVRARRVSFRAKRELTDEVSFVALRRCAPGNGRERSYSVV
jgi:hypothetical protein